MSTTMRFSGLFDLSELNVHIFGCGAIGSAAGMDLSRMGVGQINLYDHDTVCEENVGVSEYSLRDIGELKAFVLADKLELLNRSVRVKSHARTIKKDSYPPMNKEDIAILAYDNMKARLYTARGACKQKVGTLIDARMGSEQLQLYTFLSPSISQYKKYWYSDDEGDREACNIKATSYCSSLAGSFVANAVKKVVTGQPYKEAVLFHFPEMILTEITK